MTGDECSILFGESKYSHEPDTWLPIAKRRGLPTNMAAPTALAVQEAKQNNDALMGTWGFTHISYDEIEQIDWEAYPGAELLDLKASYSWGLLLQLMQTLDNASKHQRLIIWFEWR